jgi:hypothetical protein
MRPPKSMANRSQRKLDMKRLWDALKEDPPGPIRSIPESSTEGRRTARADERPADT